MDLRGLDPTVMLDAAHAYASPGRLRPVLEKYPDLAAFAKRMEAVEKTLRKAMDAVDEETERRAKDQAHVEALRAKRNALISRHDDVYRVMWFTLEALRYVEDEALRRQHEGMRTKLMPQGRTLLRNSVVRKTGQARASEEILDAVDRDALAKVASPSGTLLEMQSLRFRLAEDLTKAQDAFTDATALDPEILTDLRKAKKAWRVAVRALLGVMKMAPLEPKDRQNLLIPIVLEVQKVAERRARAQLRRAATTDDVANDLSGEIDEVPVAG